MNKTITVEIDANDYFDWNLDSISLANRFESSAFCAEEITAKKEGLDSWHGKDNVLFQVSKDVWLSNDFWQELALKNNPLAFNQIITKLTKFLNNLTDNNLQKEILEKTDLINIVHTKNNNNDLITLSSLHQFEIFSDVFSLLYSPLSSMRISQVPLDREKFKDASPFDINNTSVESDASELSDKIKSFILNSNTLDLYFLNSKKINDKWFMPNLSDSDSISLILADVKELESVFFKLPSHPVSRSQCSTLDYIIHTLPVDKKQDINFLFKLNNALLKEDLLTRTFPVEPSAWISHLFHTAPSFISYFEHVTDFLKEAKSKCEMDKAHIIYRTVYEAYYRLGSHSREEREKIKEEIKNNKSKFIDGFKSILKILPNHELNHRNSEFYIEINSLVVDDKELVNSLVTSYPNFASLLSPQNLSHIDSIELRAKALDVMNESLNRLPVLPQSWHSLETWLKVSKFKMFENSYDEDAIKYLQKETGLFRNPEFVSHLIDCNAKSCVYYALKTYSVNKKNKDLFYKMAKQGFQYDSFIHPSLLENTEFLLEMVNIDGPNFINTIPTNKWQDDNFLKLMLQKIEEEHLAPSSYLPPYLISSMSIDTTSGQRSLMDSFNLYVEKRNLINTLKPSPALDASIAKPSV